MIRKIFQIGKFDFFLMRRLIFSQHTNPIFSFFSILGIGLSVTVTIVMLSVMNGIKENFVNNIMNVQSHAQVYPQKFHITEDIQLQIQKISQLSFVKKVIPIYQGTGVMIFGDVMTPVSIKYLDLMNDHRFKQDIDTWNVPLDENSVVLSIERNNPQDKKCIQQGDRIFLYEMDMIVKLLRQNNKNIVDMCDENELMQQVWGFFNHSSVQVDGFFSLSQDNKKTHVQNLILRPMQAYHIPNMYEFFLHNPCDVDLLRARLPKHWRVVSWKDHSKVVLDFLNNQERLLTILMIFMMMMSVFIIFALMSLIVVRKYNTIGLMKLSGCSPYRIFRIFFCAGCCLGIVGIVLGDCLGVCIVYYSTSLQKAFEHFMGVPVFIPSAFWTSVIPTQLVMTQLIKINLCSFVFVMIFTIHPAYQAVKLSPSKLLMEN